MGSEAEMTLAEVEPTRRVRLEADDRRAQMIAAALTVFAQKPYDAVSTAELAKAAGTTRTNLNYHFGNKRNLYLEAIRRFATLPASLPAEAVGGTVEQGVDRLFARWLDLVERNRETFMALAHARRSSNDDEVAALLAASLAAWEDRLLEVLRLSSADGAARARMRAFQAMVGAATEEWLDRGTLSKDQVRTMLTHTLLTIGKLNSRPN
ncbi:TetR/AcrR family transcriptional regulator [Rhodococcus ruber]|uniref:TetR/AcrR family transcriptional regulator n=1 Tax=Rhodococcus ruber TaxID=1830 RepID=UPI00315C4E72